MEIVVPSSEHSLLTRKEAATKLRVSLPTLDKLILEQKLPTVIVRKRVFIADEKLSSFIQKGGAT